MQRSVLTVEPLHLRLVLGLPHCFYELETRPRRALWRLRYTRSVALPNDTEPCQPSCNPIVQRCQSNSERVDRYAVFLEWHGCVREGSGWSTRLLLVEPNAPPTREDFPKFQRLCCFLRSVQYATTSNNCNALTCSLCRFAARASFSGDIAAAALRFDCGSIAMPDAVAYRF